MNTQDAMDELMDDLERTKVELGEFVQYAQLLEAEVCHCQPRIHDGEYIHHATCRVAEIQMHAFGCGAPHEDGRAHALCPGPHPKEDLHVCP